jgi:hypothetical protein
MGKGESEPIADNKTAEGSPGEPPRAHDPHRQRALSLATIDQTRGPRLAPGAFSFVADRPRKPARLLMQNNNIGASEP